MQAGEFVPPFYADLGAMPEAERRAIWGVMVGNEGKTRIPVRQTYEAAGFDPDELDRAMVDHLTAAITLPDASMFDGARTVEERLGREERGAGGAVVAPVRHHQRGG